MKPVKEAMDIVKRVKRVMESQPDFDLRKVKEAMARHYELLGCKMPKKVIVGDLVSCFRLVQNTGLDTSWDKAWTTLWKDIWKMVQNTMQEIGWKVMQAKIRKGALDTVRSTIWNVARIKAQTMSRNAMWDVVEDVVEGTAALNINLKNKRILRFIAIEMEILKAMEAGLGWYFPLKNKLALVPFPKIKLDERKRLHSLDGPAVEWENGSKFYFLFGVTLEKELWEKIVKREIGIKEILSLKNMEQRMSVIKMIGNERLLRETGAELVDSIRGYELYLIRDVFPMEAYFLKYVCPSTGRVYVSGIDPEIGKTRDALKAIQWKFDIKDWDEIVEES